MVANLVAALAPYLLGHRQPPPRNNNARGELGSGAGEPPDLPRPGALPLSASPPPAHRPNLFSRTVAPYFSPSKVRPKERRDEGIFHAARCSNWGPNTLRIATATKANGTHDSAVKCERRRSPRSSKRRRNLH